MGILKENNPERLIKQQLFLRCLHELTALRRPGQHQFQPDVNHTGGHVRQRDPEELGVPAGAVPGARVGSGQSVLHTAGHLGEVRVTDSVHDQALHLDVWK